MDVFKKEKDVILCQYAEVICDLDNKIPWSENVNECVEYIGMGLLFFLCLWAADWWSPRLFITIPLGLIIGVIICSGASINKAIKILEELKTVYNKTHDLF